MGSGVLVFGGGSAEYLRQNGVQISGWGALGLLGMAILILGLIFFQGAVAATVLATAETQSGCTARPSMGRVVNAILSFPEGAPTSLRYGRSGAGM